MGNIKSKPYYSELVEHYFRMAVRYSIVPDGIELHWFDFTTFWIEGLSEEDKNFIRFVFKYQFRDTTDGLYHFKSNHTLQLKRERLWELEKRFAIDAELICEDEKIV